mgnify:CR=1 FL=1
MLRDSATHSEFIARHIEPSEADQGQRSGHMGDHPPR